MSKRQELKTKLAEHFLRKYLEENKMGWEWRIKHYEGLNEGLDKMAEAEQKNKEKLQKTKNE